ncbi:hypothetical protein [Tautonia rosea]|uniref:hypothetical protein n=1 Tax=Tautonia rosea TaxID=2728037 RepID=UPI0014734362|nr:hypothetical protein [Tautonia rosea]
MPFHGRNSARTVSPFDAIESRVSFKAMSRIRNLRYAPEFLERRLSPSSFGLVATAEVSTLDGGETFKARTSEAPLPRDQNGDPIPEPTQGDGPGQPMPA